MRRPVQPDYLCVLDFEATCEEQGRAPQEIIEFPVVLLNTRTLAVEAEFHRFVRPEKHPRLSEFCTSLTGIAQSQVDSGIALTDCLEEFDAWLRTQRLVSDDGEAVAGRVWIFVTAGDWDLRTMLPDQCRRLGLYRRPYFARWCNVQRVFTVGTGRQSGLGLPAMLAHLALPLVGRHHSGIADARNVAAICVALVRLGCVFCPTLSVH